MSKAKVKLPAKHQPKQQKIQPPPARSRASLWFMLAIIVLGLVCFVPGLKNELTNWDDTVYVKENPLVKSLDKETVSAMFSRSHPVSLNYHPITILSLAMNYSSSGLEAKGYILTNIIIHILTSLLLFIFVRMLTRGREWIAGITALLFAIHPMHVESVVWVSERKDVLYVFFFIAGLIAYMRYLDTRKILFITAAFILFVLSCLSKAMAVVFPVILLLIDFYYDRKISLKSLLEKIPFLAVSAVLGLLAVQIQSREAINAFSTFTFVQRVDFASYGFVVYIAKLFVPVHLSAFYPYPLTDAHGDIPGFFHIMPVLMLAVLATPFIVYRKNKEPGKVLIFGIGFYLITVALVLQFISVGSAIMADRYSYLSYVGLFFIIGWLIDHYFIEKKSIAPALAIIVIAAGVFTYACRERVKVWKNSETLWTDVIEKYPMRVPTSYKNRSLYYIDHNLTDKAFNDLITMTKLPEKDAGGYNNLGNVYSMRQQYKEAINAYTEALKINNRIFDAHLNRGITYSILKEYDKAFTDFAEAEKIDPNSPKLYPNRAYTYFTVNKFEQAIKDYDRAIPYNPEDANLYFYRGLSHFNLKHTNEAIADFNKAIELKPDFSAAYYNLSVVYNNMGDVTKAYENAKKAKEHGFAVEDNYVEMLRSRIK